MYSMKAKTILMILCTAMLFSDVNFASGVRENKDQVGLSTCVPAHSIDAATYENEQVAPVAVEINYFATTSSYPGIEISYSADKIGRAGILTKKPVDSSFDRSKVPKMRYRSRS